MAAFSISPSVNFKEVDLSTLVSSVATTTGAFAGAFAWGPIQNIISLSSESDLVSRFGKPTTNNFQSFFTASNFLAYSSDLRVVRADATGLKNAVASGTAIKIKNSDEYELSFANGEGTCGIVAAKYAGSMGNSLKFSMADAATFTRTLTGTVAVTNGSAIMTGTGTKFDEEVVSGSIIKVTVSATLVTKKVLTVNSPTSITLDSVYTAAGTGATATAEWEYASYFDSAPFDSNAALATGASADGIHIVIVDEDGVFTGTSGTVLAKYDNISKASNAMRYDGTSGYYKTVLNDSGYLYWMDHPDTAQTSASGAAFGTATAGTAFKTLKAPISASLIGGVDDYAVTDGNLQLAYDLFANTEKVDVSLIMSGKASAALSAYVINLAQSRADCVAFVSPNDQGAPIIGDTSESITKIIAFRNALGVSSSYGVMDSGVKYQYDKYNDVYRWIPLNGDIAGLCARTDLTNDPWFSPAGPNRGIIKNVIKLGVNPTKAQRDDLFKVNINPVVQFAGQGVMLFGDKTLLSRPSSFDAINVRRLFIMIEKAIATASKYFLFELNNDLTRQLFAGMLNPYLRDVQGKQGIVEFLVDVGPSVNTSEVIDSQELRANIFIKPARSIRTILLSFISTRSNAVFSELEV